MGIPRVAFFPSLPFLWEGVPGALVSQLGAVGRSLICLVTRATIRGVFQLPDPPPDIVMTASWYPDSVKPGEPVWVHYTAILVENGKTIGPLKIPPAQQPYGPGSHSHIVVYNDTGDALAVYQLLEHRPLQPERVYEWPWNKP